MIKILKGNITKCSCGVFLKFDKEDTEEVEQSFYPGEFYKVHLITCPKCGRKTEVYL